MYQELEQKLFEAEKSKLFTEKMKNAFNQDRKAFDKSMITLQQEKEGLFNENLRLQQLLKDSAGQQDESI